MNIDPAITKNSEFDKNGYLVVRDFIDPSILRETPPKSRGILHYHGKTIEEVKFNAKETQVNGSASRINYVPYRKIHKEIALKLKDIIGCPVYTTYVFDRYYFSGQELKKHSDRDACEISITLHISSDLNTEWPFYIENEHGDHKVNLTPGDAVIYKGCHYKHWRDVMPQIGDEPNYYHQVFFHYVLQDGYRAHVAFRDSVNS